MTTMEPLTLPVPAPSLSVILIGPNRLLRDELEPTLNRVSARVVHELEKYPSLSQVSGLPSKTCDAIVIDLDPDQDLALSIVERVCASNPNVTVIAYSRIQDPELLVKCMRAGARELLHEPVSQVELAEVVMRASLRRKAMEGKRPLGKSFLFWGAKGGAGTSTLAAAFAVSLAEATKERVALIDLDLELGSLALLLNVTPRFSISEAIRTTRQLDGELISGMLTEHSSGVFLMAASDRYEDLEVADPREAIASVLRIVQDQFPYVVVDGATSRRFPEDSLRQANAIYLVTQMDVPSLRNANRLIAYLTDQVGVGERTEVVLNRYSASKSDISLQQVEQSLRVPVKWRIPNSYAEAIEGLNTGRPIASRSTSLSRSIRAMSLQASGKPPEERSKSGWSLFR